MSAPDDDYDLPEFSGKRAELGTYLDCLERAFQREPQTFSSDRTKVIFATSHLRGAAMKWVLSHPEASGDNYSKFVEDIKGRFGNPDKTETAFTQLKKLKQHGSARNYRERFAKYSEDVEWGSDKTKKNKWFYRGLKDDIKDALMHCDWDWKNDFDHFADMVVKIDEKLNPPHLNEQENRYGEKKAEA